MFSSLSAWTVALSLAIVPAVAMLDYGGVVPWTRWAVAVACTVTGLIALPWVSTKLRWSWSSLVWPIAAVVTCLVVALQTVSMPTSVVQWLSPASSDAYAMIGPPTDTHPASVAPWLTRLSIAAPAILGISVLLGTACFRERRTAVTWMFLVTIGAVLLAILGVGEKLDSGDGVLWPATQNMDAVPFGPYVNRNNAACQLNLALASAIGAIVFMSRRNASKVGYGAAFPPRKGRSGAGLFAEVMSFIRRADGTTILAATLCVLIATAVIVTGSRGGLLGAIAGALAVAIGLSQRGRRMGPAIFVGVAVVATFALVAGIGSLGAIKDRLPSTLADVLGDARWGNWHDAVIAGFHHLPLGSGGGTYRFAYLPFQESSGPAWFVNADCLPLEWFVELGLIGLVIPAAAALFLLQQSLWLRRSSRDAIDRAAAAVGLFVVASQSVSQTFDFGLLQLPAVITLGASAGLVFARCSVVRQRLRGVASPEEDHTDGPITAESRWGRIAAIPCNRFVAIGCMVVLLVPLAWSTIAWRHEAESDLLRRAVAGWNRNPPPTSGVLLGALDAAGQLVSAAPLSGDANLLLAELRVIQSRSEAWWAFPAQSDLDPDVAWKLTSPAVGRARYFTAPADQRDDLQSVLFPGQKVAPLRQAAKLSWAALRASPLDDAPRYALTTLDFLGSPPQSTERMIDQIALLRRKTPDSLTRAARLSIWNPGPAQAAKIYRQALLLDPELLVKEWSLISRLPVPSITGLAATAGIFPLLDAAQRGGLDPSLREALLDQGDDLLSRDAGGSLIGRYDESLARGRIALLREDPQAAVRHFQQAITEQPQQIDARIRLAHTFRSLGKVDKSQQQLQVLTTLAPADLRVKLLADLVKRDLAVTGGER